MKSAFLLLAKFIALTLLYFVSFAAVSALVFRLPAEAQENTDTNAAGALLVVSFLNSLVLTHLTQRARLAGWKLAGAIFLILFGVLTVLPQIETAFFVTTLPPGMLPRIFLAGGLTAAIIAVAAVLIFGKWRGLMNVSNARLREVSRKRLILKLCAIAVIYVALYFTFGYYIAWQSSAVRNYYGGSDPGSFILQMRTVLSDTPELVLLQIFRALLWTGLALLVIQIVRGPWWEVALMVALLFSVVMNTQLLIPNPFMPAEVRFAHLIETASSNFLFGWLVVWILSSRTLFGWRSAASQTTHSNLRK
jgi:hypothetical protein